MTNNQIIEKCAQFAAIYWNDATIQRSYTIEEFIILSMEDIIND
jgi:hypothetical protein